VRPVCAAHARLSGDADGIADADGRALGAEARLGWRGRAKADPHSPRVACVFCGLELPLARVGAHQERCAEALPCASLRCASPRRHTAVPTPPFDAALASPTAGGPWHPTASASSGLAGA
jgi:hypothetical protein